MEDIRENGQSLSLFAEQPMESVILTIDQSLFFAKEVNMTKG